MGRSKNRHTDDSTEKNWKLIVAAIVPVWGVVMFIGWFVISALVPMLDEDQANQIANDRPEKALTDFNTAAGGNNAGNAKILPPKQ